MAMNDITNQTWSQADNDKLSNDASNQDMSISLKIVVAMLSVFSVVGVIGNAIAFYIFCRRRTTSTSVIFILALAGVDFFTCLVTIPYTIVFEVLRYNLVYDVACKLYMFLITSTQPFSAYIMVGIALDRYFCICYPFLYVFTLPRAKAVVLCMAVPALIFGLITALSYGSYIYDVSVLSDDNSSRKSVGHFTDKEEAINSLSFNNLTGHYPEINFVPYNQCVNNTYIFSKEFLHVYKTFHAMNFVIAYISVAVLYILMYKSIFTRRVKKAKRKKSNLYPTSSNKAKDNQREETQMTAINGGCNINNPKSLNNQMRKDAKCARKITLTARNDPSAFGQSELLVKSSTDQPGGEGQPLGSQRTSPKYNDLLCNGSGLKITQQTRLCESSKAKDCLKQGNDNDYSDSMKNQQNTVYLGPVTYKEDTVYLGPITHKEDTVYLGPATDRENTVYLGPAAHKQDTAHLGPVAKLKEIDSTMAILNERDVTSIGEQTGHEVSARSQTCADAGSVYTGPSVSSEEDSVYAGPPMSQKMSHQKDIASTGPPKNQQKDTVYIGPPVNQQKDTVYTSPPMNEQKDTVYIGPPMNQQIDNAYAGPPTNQQTDTVYTGSPTNQQKDTIYTGPPLSQQKDTVCTGPKTDTKKDTLQPGVQTPKGKSVAYTGLQTSGQDNCAYTSSEVNRGDCNTTKSLTAICDTGLDVQTNLEAKAKHDPVNYREQHRLDNGCSPERGSKDASKSQVSLKKDTRINYDTQLNPANVAQHSSCKTTKDEEENQDSVDRDNNDVSHNISTNYKDKYEVLETHDDEINLPGFCMEGTVPEEKPLLENLLGCQESMRDCQKLKPPKDTLSGFHDDSSNPGEERGKIHPSPKQTLIDTQENSLKRKRPGTFRDGHLMANIKTAFMLFIVTLVFIIAFLPALLMANELIRFELIVFYIYFFYNVANPFIYAFMNHTFRGDLKKIVKVCRR